MSSRSTIMWAMFNGQLIIYPLQPSTSSVEIIGVLSPPAYTDADLLKEMVKVPEDEDTEVQGLSPAQLKLVRYSVIKRLFEDKGDLAKANYFGQQVNILKHMMRATHEDDEFTDSSGEMMGDGNA